MRDDGTFEAAVTQPEPEPQANSKKTTKKKVLQLYTLSWPIEVSHCIVLYFLLVLVFPEREISPLCEERVLEQHQEESVPRRGVVRGAEWR
jgi:hypothetical protein